MPKFLSKLNLPRYGSAPSSPTEADLYYNTSDDKIYYYTGSAWQEVGSGAGGNIVYYQTTAPGTANAGDIWIDSNDDLLPTIPLTDSVSSTSTITAATPNSVKTAYDLASTANTTANAAVPKDTVTTKGDLIVATGSATVSRLGKGTDTYVLTADSNEATGLKWVAPSSADITEVIAGSGLTGGASSGAATLNVGSGTGITVTDDAVSIDTSVVATLGGTQTLTNKTLTSPTLTTPDLGTPSAINLTNATNLPGSALPSLGTAGTYTKVTTDSTGRVSAGTVLEENDIPTISASKVSGTAIVESDARLTDARTPTAHATSHKSGGTDAIKLNEFASPDGSVSLNSQKITNLATPTADADAATKAYVDAATAGLNVHDSVKAATTTNINLANALENADTIDGVVVSTGDRVLVKNQTNKTENGVYIVAASGAASRATDYDSSGEVDAGDFIFVEGGTNNAKTGWVQTNAITTLGTDDIEFTQFSGVGTYTAGTALTLTGNQFSVQLTDATNSTSTTTAATPNSVKSAYDLASAAIPKSVVTTSGDIIYASGSGSVTRLGIGTATQVLQVGTAGIPEWGQPVATIGTANSSGTYGVTTLIDSVSNTSTSAAAVPNSVKTSYDLAVTKAKVSVGTAAPSSPATGDVWVDTADSSTIAVNAIPSAVVTTAGDLIVASGSAAVQRLGIGDNGKYLTVAAGMPSWAHLGTATTGAYGITQLTDSTSSTSTTTSATPNSVKTAYDTAATAIPKNTATTAGDLLYASGSATITRLGIGSTDQMLVVAAGAPSWAYKPNIATNAQSGTAYTLALADAGKLVELSNAAAITLTVPTNGSAAFPVGTQIDLLQTGAGTVTVGGAGVTLQSNGSKLKLNGQYAAATLIKRATDTWVLIGNTAA